MSGRFVVGADGALGRAICAVTGARGVSLRHPGECLDAVVPEIAGADVVINVSGPRVRPRLGWADYLREHVGTATAIARAMPPGSHMVHVSSAAVWGVRAGLIDASTPEAPLSFPNPSYAWAKLAGELAARAICGERGVKLSVLRPAMVYGEGITSAIDTLFALAKKGLKVSLLPLDGKQHQVHLSVLCSALSTLLARGPVTHAALPVADPFIFTNADLNVAVGRNRRGLTLPAPLSVAETLLRRWPIFPDRDGPGALSAFAALGMDNAFDWRPTFDALGLRADDFAREKTLSPYLESYA